MTDLWTPNGHPVQQARGEYDAMLGCPGLSLSQATGHQMEDGDVCKLCGASGFAIRARAEHEDRERQAKELLERAAE